MFLTLFKNIAKRTAPLTILALLALLSWWLKDTTLPTQKNVDSSIRHDPDYYSDNLKIYLMDKEGKLHHQLKVKHLKHYPDDESTQLSEPQMTLYKNKKTNWVISSEQGEIIDKGKKIMLKGNVIAIQSDTKAKMVTDSLLIRPDEQYAQTNSKVKLEDVRGVTHAIGMKIYFEENNIQLLSSVRGRYANP